MSGLTATIFWVKNDPSPPAPVEKLGLGLNISAREFQGEFGAVARDEKHASSS